MSHFKHRKVEILVLPVFEGQRNISAIGYYKAVLTYLYLNYISLYLYRSDKI